MGSSEGTRTGRVQEDPPLRPAQRADENEALSQPFQEIREALETFQVETIFPEALQRKPFPIPSPAAVLLLLSYLRIYDRAPSRRKALSQALAKKLTSFFIPLPALLPTLQTLSQKATKNPPAYLARALEAWISETENPPSKPSQASPFWALARSLRKNQGNPPDPIPPPEEFLPPSKENTPPTPNITREILQGTLQDLALKKQAPKEESPLQAKLRSLYQARRKARLSKTLAQEAL